MRKPLCLVISLLFLLNSFSQTVSGNKSLCGGNASLTVTPAGDSYQWQYSSTGNDPWNNATGVNTNKDYTATAEGYYRVIVKYGADAKTSASYYVVNSQKPDVSFTFTRANECSSTPVTFTSVATPGATYLWSFGDVNSGGANNSTAANPSHTFIGTTGNNTQTFPVQLTVTSKDGCIGSATQTVTTKQLPDATLNNGGTVSYQGKNYFTSCNGVTPANFEFINDSKTSSTNTTYKIQWGDGSPDFTSTGFLTEDHSYATGQYSLNLTVTGQNGCSNTTSYFIFVGTNPAAGFANPGNSSICTGTTLTFPITSTTNNPPTTIYTVTFNDGTPVITYQHPPPADITHTFVATSCGTNSKSYSNSFSAVLTASNPCQSSAITVEPIFVSQKAEPSITVTPKDTDCVNSTVTFTNSSPNNYNNNNGTCTLGKSVWTVAPSTGWTIISGSLGDDRGLTNPPSWTDGSLVLSLKFTTAGTYTIKLKTGNTNCGSGETTKTICVSSAPTADFTTDVATTGCAPYTIKTTNNSNHPECGTNKYVWTITSITSANCDIANPAYEFVGGTDVSSENPQFRFNSAGTYTISLVNTFDPSGCSSPLVSKTITVKGKPKVTVNNIASVCQNQNISPTASYSCNTDAATTYNWSFPGGSPASSTSVNPGNIAYASPGNYAITLQVTNSCGTATANQSFSVNALPDITVPASSSYCAGSNVGPFSFTGNPSGTITWTNDNTATGLGRSGNGDIAAFIAINNTSSTQVSNITVTTTANGCTAIKTFAISVYPKVNAPTVTSPVQLCQNNTAAPLTASGSNLLWYDVESGGTSSSTAPTPSTTNLGTKNYYVTQTINSCESPRAPIVVSVNASPTFTVIASNPTQCGVANGSLQLQGLTAGTAYTITYTQDGANKTTTQAADANGVINISNLLAGVYDNIIVAAFGCPSAKQGPFTLSSPHPPATPVLTSNAPICSGNTLQLNASTTSTGTAIWNWSGPNNFVNTAQNPVIANVPAAASGVYRATVTINNCTSAAGEITVVINPTPAIPVITSNSPLCSGNNLAFTNSSNGDNITYNWTGPNGFSRTDKNPSILNATTAATGTYQVIATLGNCTSVATTEVIVNETPVIADTSSTQPTQCASTTGSITLKGLLANKIYTVQYKLNGATVSKDISSDNSGNVLIDKLTAGTYDNIGVSLNNCLSNTKGPITLSDPHPPDAPTVSSNAPLCAGATLNLTATSGVSGTYTWSGPNNFSSTDQNPVLTNIAVNNAGAYKVTLTVNNCTSLPASTNVIVNPLAAAPIAATPVEYCINTTAVPLTATATNGGTINWYETASGGTPSATAPMPLTTTAGSVFYYASQTSTAGCEGARAAVEVITHPDAKAMFLPLQTLGCAPFAITSSIINLQTFPNNNKSYQWFANNVLTGSGTTFPIYTIQNDNDSVIIKLKATSLFGCKDDSTIQKFFTYQLPKTAFIANQTSGCGPLIVSFTNTTPQADRFQFKWIFGNGQISTNANPPTVVFATNPTYGDTTYHITLLGYTVCDTIKATTDIVVKSKPKALFAPDKTTGCSPMTVQFSNISKGFGTGYQWFFGDGTQLTTTDAIAVEHTYITGIQDTFDAKLAATNNCGSDTSAFAIVVSPNKVKLKVAINGNQATGCAPLIVQFINRSSGASAFNWDFGDGNKISTKTNIDTVTHIYTKGGTYTTALLASNGCSDTTTTLTVTVFDKPVAIFNALPLSACIGDTISFANKATNYSSLLWKFGDGPTSTATNPQHAYATAGIYNAQLIAQKQYENGTVCSDTATTSLTIVDQLPGSFSASQTVSSCVPFTVTFTNTTLPSVLTTWLFDDGFSDTGNVVTHTFLLPGKYNVTMKAKHPAGCLYEANKQIIVKGPVGNISYAAGYVCNNAPVRFEANTTNTDSVRWSFGDGIYQITTARVVYHAFNKPGVFVPSAELISGNGCRVPVATNDTIKVDYLQAGFNEQKEMICGSTTVHFNDTSSAYFGLQRRQWNLGDGTTSSSQNPIHTYMATGTLPIQLISISNSGCADTASVSLFIKVNNKPHADIVGSTNACDLLPVAYSSSVSSIDSVSLYQWTITPNISYNTNNIIHAFPNAGNYNVQLVVGTAYGCYDTTMKKVIVNTTPVVKASGGATICQGASAALLVTGNAAQYNWQTEASLSCTACANPLAAPLSTTQYYVTGTAANGCSRTDSVLINVVQPFTLTVSKSDSICIGQSKQLTVSGAAQYVWSPAATLDDFTSQHPVATPLASTTYSVTGNDDHHCFTDTKTVVVGVGKYPKVSLGKDTLLSTGTIYPLHSVITEGPMKTYSWSPAADLSCSNCAVPDATVKRPVCYSLTATNYYGCSGSDTMCIKVFCQSGQVFIANIFTPDGDGINDKLIVQGKGIALIRSFRIFNRWGQVVFEKSGFPPNDASSGWDGRINGGTLASPDVYVYTCDVVCDDGTVYPLKGNVAIVK